MEQILVRFLDLVPVNVCVIFYAPRKISGEHIVVALSVRQSVRPIRVRPITSLFEVGF